MRECLKQNPSNFVCAANRELRVISGSTSAQQNNIFVSRSRGQSVSTSLPHTPPGISTFAIIWKTKTWTNQARKQKPQHQSTNFTERHPSLGLVWTVSKLCLEDVQYMTLRADFFFWILIMQLVCCCCCWVISFVCLHKVNPVYRLLMEGNGTFLQLLALTYALIPKTYLKLAVPQENPMQSKLTSNLMSTER